MRASTCLILGLSGFATSAVASIPSLESTAGAGACGGSIGCAATDDQILPTTNPAATLYATEQNSLPDGSYASAHVLSSFGAIHAYSASFRASGGDAQSSAEANVYDIIPAALIQGGQYQAKFAITGSAVITGSFSPYDPDFGNYAYARVQWLAYDNVTGALLDNAVWESTDAMQSGTLIEDFTATPGHAVKTRLEFEVATYSSYGLLDVADYSHTLRYFLSSVAPGPDLVGLSGYDYAPRSAVPEPAGWALMICGLGVAGAGLRRRVQSSAAG